MFFGKRMGGMTYGGGGVALEAARGVSQSGNRIAGTAWHTHSPHRLWLGGHRWMIRMCGSEKYAQRTEEKSEERKAKWTENGGLVRNEQKPSCGF
jgi:hypothetical protein